MTVDSYMAELKVLIKECGYEQNMQNILLKDQFIFGVTGREIQEHLLNGIEDDHVISTIAYRKQGKLDHVQHNASY